MPVTHPIPPVFSSDSRVLILGSFPSVKSREACFFYHHPQNRFWRVLASLFDEAVPKTIPARRDFLLSHGIAVWDVIAACDVTGSSDASVRNAVPNDLSVILEAAPIRAVFCNGALAMRLYRRFFVDSSLPVTALPSTSPANACSSLADLCEAWACVRDVLNR